MPVERLSYYIQRKHKIIGQKFKAFTNNKENWTYIAKRQVSLRKEIEILDQLIIVTQQSKCLTKSKPEFGSTNTLLQ
jgi:hypothetical protein